MKFIGGFFEVAFPTNSSASFADLWQMPQDVGLTYANARSALTAMLRSLNPTKLWLPAYICRSVAEAAASSDIDMDYFPVGKDLVPDVAFLESAAQEGNMILAVNYFGKSPPDAFLEFVRTRNDLIFLEDAAQTIDTKKPQWGNWRLHSPRKLLGVVDGGFVTPATAIISPYKSIAEYNSSIHYAAWLRFEDKEGERNSEWHTANQTREAAETVTHRQMSHLSRAILANTPVTNIARQRHENFSVLAYHLKELSFLDTESPNFVPFGFPIVLESGVRDKIRHLLIAENIFPSVHWQDLPSPPSFRDEHCLATQLLTLPCDHRYGVLEMARMAEIIHRNLYL